MPSNVYIVRLKAGQTMERSSIIPNGPTPLTPRCSARTTGRWTRFARRASSSSVGGGRMKRNEIAFTRKYAVQKPSCFRGRSQSPG